MPKRLAKPPVQLTRNSQPSSPAPVDPLTDVALPYLPPVAAVTAMAPSLIPTHPRKRNPISPERQIRLQRILALKVGGATYEEISSVMGLTPATVKQYLYEAGKKGWLTSRDDITPQEALEFDLSHTIVQNVRSALGGKSLTDQQQEMTIVAAKGIGLFKNHEVSKAETSVQMNVLSVKMVVAEGEALPVAPGSMGGTPGFIEGVAIDTE